MLLARPISLLSMCLAFTVVPSAVMAGLAHPASWKQTSEDDRFVLVMVSPLSVDEDARPGAFDGGEIRKIRATYTQSGLYHKGDTAHPVWTVPYHNRTHEVFIAPDGQHLIIADDDWFRSHGHVVTFYSNGTKLSSYAITDLLPLAHLRFPILGRVDCGGIAFDADALTFSSSTNQGSVFVFDVTTGKITRRSSPFPKLIGIAVAGVAMAAVFLLLLLRRERDETTTVQSRTE